MKWSRVAVALGPLTLSLSVAGLTACGGERLPPKALVDARSEFQQAKGGVAIQLDPTDVHEADLALQKAEQAWSDEPDDPNTIDLAVIAQRKAQIAEAQAAALKSAQDEESAKRDLMSVQANQLQAARGQLDQTKQALNKTQEQLQSEQQLSAAQKAQLADMEAKLKDARDTIAKIAAVKDDDRGMVITLQGEVLFKTGKWDLKAGAMAKLDQIADALRGKEQPIVVYGFTDNVGASDMNMDLSQKRAQSVRDYLVTKGIPQDLITAQGKGQGDPISDNGSVEGRAANRRVELVVSPKKT
ncbi:MAG TPA: OmpA family protein [Polyangiaceae bacterium]|jgi:outer membrane protein OmpA-like peptidoglycan-associated protein|nr:OmpA family protein [Polyangiaceae bacterium]